MNCRARIRRQKLGFKITPSGFFEFQLSLLILSETSDRAAAQNKANSLEKWDGWVPFCCRLTQSKVILMVNLDFS